MGSVTIGSNTYNIYGTSAGADAYLAARIGASSWASATADTRAQALVTGTRMIETYLSSQGFTVDPAGAVDEAIENANYELAFALLTDPTIQDKAVMDGGNKKRVKAGSAEVEYFRPGVATRFPSTVQALLNGWISAQGGGVSTSPVYSGTDNKSTLCPGDYSLTEGY